MTRRSDDEIQRLLEEWLDAEGRPMPPEVLESSLEALTRTAQIGSPGRANHRPVIRWAAPILAVAAVVLLIVAAPAIVRDLGGFIGFLPGGPGPSDSPQTWDPAVDFRAPPGQANPSPDRYGNPDVWSYLRSASGTHSPSVYLALPNFQVSESGADQWYQGDLVNLFIGHSRDSPSLSVHPWSDGDPDHDHNAIVAWTSPESGWFLVTASAHMEATQCPVSADGITFSIDQNAAVLRSTSITLGQAPRTLEVKSMFHAGDELYFVVAPRADAHCDGTELTISITGPYPS